MVQLFGLKTSKTFPEFCDRYGSIDLTGYPTMDILTEKIESLRKRKKTDHPLSEGKMP